MKRKLARIEVKSGIDIEAFFSAMCEVPHVKEVVYHDIYSNPQQEVLSEDALEKLNEPVQWNNFVAYYLKVTPRTLPHLKYLQTLPQVKLADSTIDASFIEHLLPCLGIQSIELNRCQIDEEAAALFNKLGYTTLELRECEFTPTLMKSLGQSFALRAFKCINSPLDDEGLKHLSNVATISHLELIDTQITDAGLASIGNFPVLNQLRLPAGGLYRYRYRHD
ncbi:MAG: hypothetical protein R3C11_13360 [Planctomycetaceae bacterium]